MDRVRIKEIRMESIKMEIGEETWIKIDNFNVKFVLHPDPTGNGNSPFLAATTYNWCKDLVEPDDVSESLQQQIREVAKDILSLSDRDLK